MDKAVKRVRTTVVIICTVLISVVLTACGSSGASTVARSQRGLGARSSTPATQPVDSLLAALHECEREKGIRTLKGDAQFASARRCARALTASDGPVTRSSFKQALERSAARAFAACLRRNGAGTPIHPDQSSNAGRRGTPSGRFEQAQKTCEGQFATEFRRLSNVAAGSQRIGASP
jgi:hypothetical protein